MDNFVITAASNVTNDNLRDARLGSRFGRMDTASQLALYAVERLGLDFDSLPRERIAICLAASASSLATDWEYWKGRDGAGGPSPTLFTYTLPSAAIGEIAIRHRLTGPSLCFVGDSKDALREAADFLERGEADGCICVQVNVVSDALATIIQSPPTARASAVFVQPGEHGLMALGEFDRDIEALCASLRHRIAK
jgi:3-oxoacyl-(acyl-carrier-protein) synthase